MAEPLKEEDQVNKTGHKIKLTSGHEVHVNKISAIDMQVGDAVLYHGMDNIHWREKFEGKWQAQVFLHYVDAEGKYAEWIYDKKEKLSHHTSSPDRKDYFYWVFEDGFSPEACSKLIESCESQLETRKAFIANSKLDTNIRDVNKIELPHHRGIGATLAGMALLANKQAWKFDVSSQNQTEYLKYDVDGHYVSHIDTVMNPESIEETRKLTTLAFLNDDFEGGRFYIQVGNQREYPPQKAGTTIVFPSFILHGVEPVTKGIRRSVVTWLVGPWFK
jgi:PKHD-type hydroxylase